MHDESENTALTKKCRLGGNYKFADAFLWFLLFACLLVGQIIVSVAKKRAKLKLLVVKLELHTW